MRAIFANERPLKGAITNFVRLFSRRAIVATAVLASCGDPSAVDSPGARRVLPPAEEVRALPSLGGFWARARAINEFGRIVGEASIGQAGRWRAFSWSPIGGIRDLGTLGGAISGAVAISLSSQVAGWAETGVGTTHAFKMTVGDATMRDLGTPTGGLGSGANDINDDGVVVGRWIQKDLRTGAFVWTDDGGMRALRSVSDSDEVEAMSVNRAGQIAGVRRDTTGLLHAVLWSVDGIPRDLEVPDGTTESMAYAINATSHVVGARRVGNGPWLAVVWPPQQAMRDLGVLAGMDWSVAFDISDNGHVVGSSGSFGTQKGRAFLWTEEVGMNDLGTLPSDRAESGAFAVNSSGRAVGYSWDGAVYLPVIFRP